MRQLAKLKIDSTQLLHNDELLKLRGGSMDLYTCHCGFVGGPWEEETFDAYGTNLEAALQAAGHECDGRGATCYGA